MKNILGINLLLVLISTICFAQKSEINYCLKMGDSYKYKEVSKQIIARKNKTTEITTTITSEKIYSIKVVNIAKNKNITIKIDYSQIKFNLYSTHLGQENISYDSSKNEKVNAQTAWCKAMIDAPITIICNSKYEIIKVKGIDKLIVAIVNNIDLKNYHAKTEILKELSKNISKEKYINQIQNSLFVLPNKQLTEKQQWTKKTHLQILTQDLIFDTNYTLSELKKQKAKINLQANFSLKSKKKKEEIMVGVTYKVKLEGKQTGNITVDPATGMIIKSNIEQIITEKTQFGNLTPKNMPILTKIKNSISIEKI